MSRTLEKVISILISIALAFSAWSVPALAEAAEEAMGEEPAAAAKKDVGPTDDPALVEEHSATGAEPEEVKPKSELSEEGLGVQSTDDPVTISEDDEFEQRLAAQDFQVVLSANESPEDALQVQADCIALPTPTTNGWRNDYVKYARNGWDGSFSYLHIVNGALERVEYHMYGEGTNTGQLVVERVDSSLRYVTSRSLVDRSTYVPSDLVSQGNFEWGGFYSGADHNYVLTGQRNDAENNELTVFRLTKYTKAWQYVNAIEIRAANTTYPFYDGSCEMIELNGNLYVRTAHQMYTSSDGYRHQANVQMVINESQLTPVKVQADVSNWTTGYVSHSFAQLLARSESAVFGLDHGDTYPRSVFVKGLTSNAQDYYASLITFGGRVGTNMTGCSVGGMEHSSTTSKLLVVGNLADQSVLFGDSSPSDSSVARNVFVVTTTTPNLSSSSVRHLTSYAPNSTLSATTPHIVKINENRFLVLWGEKNPQTYSGFDSKVYYQFIDGSGNALSGVRQGKGMLSNCKPVLWGNRVVWFAGGDHYTIYDEKVTPAFYAIDVHNESFASYVPFHDVAANDWYTGMVLRAAGLGLISGYSNGNFGPADKIIRGQVAVILWNMAGNPTAGAGAQTFTDVGAKDYYYNAVRWASSVGVVSGYGNGKFGPKDNVTREQLAVMLANYAKNVRGRAVTGSEADYASMADRGKVSSWAVTSVGWCFRNKILSGSGGNVNPGGNASRAEDAKMVVVLYDLLA